MLTLHLSLELEVDLGFQVCFSEQVGADSQLLAGITLVCCGEGKEIQYFPSSATIQSCCQK